MTKTVHINRRTLERNHLRNEDNPPIEIHENGKCISKHHELEFSGRVVYDPKSRLCSQVYIEINNDNNRL